MHHLAERHSTCLDAHAPTLLPARDMRPTPAGAASVSDFGRGPGTRDARPWTLPTLVASMCSKHSCSGTRLTQVSSIGRGKHTTRNVTLLEVAGGLLADTPGFNQPSLDALPAADLPELFPEIQDQLGRCGAPGPRAPSALGAVVPAACTEWALPRACPFTGSVQTSASLQASVTGHAPRVLSCTATVVGTA